MRENPVMAVAAIGLTATAPAGDWFQKCNNVFKGIDILMTEGGIVEPPL